MFEIIIECLSYQKSNDKVEIHYKLEDIRIQGIFYLKIPTNNTE